MTTTKAPGSTSRSSPSKIRFAPYRLASPRAPEEHDADHTVHGEERRVEPAQVGRRHERVLDREQRTDCRDAEPVREPEVEVRADECEQQDREHVQDACAPEDALGPEAGGEAVQALAVVDLGVEQGVEEVEARDPAGDRAAELPRRERQLPGDRDPRAHRRQPVHRTEPEMAEPGEPLQVGVDHEAGNGDRPEPADDRVELEDGDEEDQQRGNTEQDYLCT